MKEYIYIQKSLIPGTYLKNCTLKSFNNLIYTYLVYIRAVLTTFMGSSLTDSVLEGLGTLDFGPRESRIGCKKISSF